MEIWKPVAGFEQYYEVSNEGRVKSLRTGRIRKLVPNSQSRYLTLFLVGESGKRCVYVHRLVATAFCENPNGYDCVNHKDENRQNNKADNLEWCTKAYNNAYSHLGERSCKPIAQIKDGKVIRVWASAREAEKHFDTNYKNISAVCRGLRPRAGGYEWRFI